MKKFIGIVSVLFSIVLVVFASQFGIGKTVLYYIGIVSTIGTTTITIYIVIDTLIEWWTEWWNENVKKNKKDR